MQLRVGASVAGVERSREVRANARRGRCAGVLACALLTAASPSARADQQVDTTYHYFSDSVGNSIDSYVVNYLQGLGGPWSVALRGMLDRVHLPPLPGLPGSRENVDAITAASRPVQSAVQSKESYTKQRQEMTGTVAWRPHDRRLRISSSYYASHESDFLGQQVSTIVGRDWNGGNASLALRTAVGFDRITPDEHTGGDPTPRSRTTIDVTSTWVQSLSPKSQAQLGVELNSVTGFQANPYRKVYAGGQPLPETHPESRLRGSVFGQIDRYLTTRASVSLGARGYTDDWGIRAGSVEVLFNQYLGDRLIVRYRYRYYQQTAATFYRDLYASSDGIDGYRTADYKLQDFDSNLFGIKVSVPFESSSRWLDGLLLDLKYERYFDSHSFAANVLETGISWPF